MKKERAQKLMAETKKGYEAIAGHFSKTRSTPWPETVSFLKENIFEGEKVLDLGCGNGRFYPFLKGKIDYVGVDSCRSLIKEAKEKYPKSEFLEADAFSLPFPDEYFDKVFSIAVFHHIPSEKLRMEFLKESKRVLKKGGKLIFTVWKPKGKKFQILLLKFTLLKIFFLSDLDLGDVLVPWKNPSGENKFNRYYHFFSKKEIKKLIKKTSFKIKDAGILKSKNQARNNLYFVLQKEI
jgi:ubiquinone/menaquinone biosynthesis C-methylase UbiE